MHLQRQNGISPTISIDLADDHETYTVRKRQKKITKKILSFPSLPTATGKKPTPTFCRCGPMHYLQNFHLDTSKYRQIQTCDTSMIYNYY